MLLMLALIASRVLGVVRQTIFNAIFGTSAHADAYVAASHLPDTLFNLIAGGALAHAFIPVFFSYEKEHGQEEAWRLTSLVFNVLFVALTLLVILGEVFTPQIINTFVIPGSPAATRELTTSLARIMLIQPLVLGLGTVVTAILNSKRQFLLPAIATAIYNVGLIGGLLVTLAIPGVGIYGPTFGVLAAAALQVGVQIPGLFKQGVRYSFDWNLKHPGLHQVLRLLVPSALAVGVASIGSFIATSFTSYLHETGSLAAMQNAEMLEALPTALLAQAIGQALLPHLTGQATAGRFVRMRQVALKVMGASVALTIPAAIALIVLGKPMIHILFRHGAFNQHSSDMTYIALIGYALAIPGLTTGVLVSTGFYALKDTLSPLLGNIFALGARYGLTLLFLGMFSGQFVIIAIPLALAGAATAEALLMCLILLWRVQRSVSKDKGIARLQRRRAYQKGLQEEARLRESVTT